MWGSLSTDAATRLDSYVAEQWCLYLALLHYACGVIEFQSTSRPEPLRAASVGGWGFSGYISPAVITPQAVCNAPSCRTAAEQAAQSLIAVLGR